MRAMLLDRPLAPLRVTDRPDPQPGPGEICLRVEACAVCRTDLHIVDGELPPQRAPLIPGHQVVGVVEALGEGVRGLAPGDVVGVPWLGGTCGTCRYCGSGRENLCAEARFTGYHRDGGFAERMVALAAFTLPLPPGLGAAEAAPLLCAGLIGHRTLRMAGEAEAIGIYGFGAAAHLVTQVARHEGRRVFAFTRPGDTAAQGLARRLGAEWAGASDEAAPVELDAALIFAPDGALVPRALAAVARGGTVVCGGIHMSDLPSFPYELLWGERTLRSVANLTRRDGVEFLELAARLRLVAEIHRYPLERAGEALEDLRAGRFTGAAVVCPHASG